MKKFAYLFICGTEISWSGEDEKSLLDRANYNFERANIAAFIKQSKVGWHMKLSTGEFIFRTE